MVQTDLKLKLKRCKHLVEKLKNLRRLMDLSTVKRTGGNIGKEEPIEM